MAKSYIHVNNLEKFHPGYKDRKLQWMKMYFDMVQGDPEFEMISSEIDKWRFICFVTLELQAQKPLPLDDEYFKRKGFDLKKRSMSLTLKMLHNFLSIVNEDSKVCDIEEEKEEEKDKEEEKNLCYKDIQKKWNILAEKYELPKMQIFSNSRKEKFKTRNKEDAFNFDTILSVIAESKYLTENKHNWFTFDWVVENDTNYIKILEKKFLKNNDPKTLVAVEEC